MSSTGTESRGAWLWRKMAAIYGDRFFMLWRNVDPNDVQAAWADALSRVKRENLQRGVAALYHMKNPPTLPEFLAACEPPPPVPMAHQHRVEHDEPRTDSATARVRLAAIAGTIARHKRPGIDWAVRIVRDAETQFVPALKLAFAKEAIRQHESLSLQPSREPGEDDDDAQEVAA